MGNRPPARPRRYRMSTPRSVPVLVVTALLLSACGGDTDDAGGDSAPSTGRPAGAQGPAPEGSAWGAVLSAIADDGTVDRETALQAFSLAFGGMPGVGVPEGPTGDLLSGSGPLRWTVAVRDDLDADQEQALEEILDADRVHGEDVGPGRSRPLAHDGPGTSDFRSAVDEALTRYRGPLGALSVPTSVFLVPAHGTAVAYAKAANAEGDVTGSLERCIIGITPDGEQLGADGIALTIAHEVFHCYEATWLGSLALYYSTEAARPWMMEGAAEWAGINSTASEIPANLNFWSSYLVTPADPLFSHSYDAVGFYGQIAQHGVDLWPLFADFFAATGSVAAYHVLADPAGDAFLDSWAPGFWREPSRGGAWEITGKAVPSRAAVTPDPPVVAVSEGAGETVAATAYANTLRQVEARSDLLHLSFKGHARFSDADGFDSTDLSDLYLCTKEGGDCSCPDESGEDGSDGLPASRQSVSGTLLLALTGGTDGADGNLTGVSLESFCKKRNTTTTTRGTNEIAPCTLFTASDVATLTGITPSGPGVEVFGTPETSMSGICEYGPVNLGGTEAVATLYVLYRPDGAPVEDDWAMFSAQCPESISGIGTHAAVGSITDAMLGCLLDGTALVTVTATTADKRAMTAVLRRVANVL